GGDGRLELQGVQKRRGYLRPAGSPTLPLEYGRDVRGGLLALSGGDVEHLRLVASTRMHVQVELADAASADGLMVLDDKGAAIAVNVFEGRSRTTTGRLPLQNGRSPVLVVPDTAATLVLAKGDSEVRRVPLSLQLGEVNRVRL